MYKHETRLVYSTEHHFKDILLLCSCNLWDFPGVKVEYGTSQCVPYVWTMNKADVKAQNKVPSLADLALSPSLGLLSCSPLALLTSPCPSPAAQIFVTQNAEPKWRANQM